MSLNYSSFFDTAQSVNLCCPICFSSFSLQYNSLVCRSGHVFDINRRGYINFLRKPIKSIYNKSLFESRSRVQNAGLFNNIIDCIYSFLPSTCHTILDCGSGNGWFLSQLYSRYSGLFCAGIDISSEGIKLAAKENTSILWAIGDITTLPFKSNSFDVLLNVLSPANYSEFARVLNPDGFLIKVYPATDYLAEIRTHQNMARHSYQDVETLLQEKSITSSLKRITYKFGIDEMLWQDLVYMTPLTYAISDEEKRKLSFDYSPHITIDVWVVQSRLLKT